MGKKYLYLSKFTEGFGINIQHSKAEVDYLCDVVCRFNPTVIVEFGTYHGGLTLALHELDRKRQIYSFDNWSKGWPTKKLLAKLGDTVHVEGLDVQVYQPRIIQLLEMPGRKMLYVDCGNKAAGTVLYAQFLRNGDLFGVHDWNATRGGINKLNAGMRTVLNSFEELQPPSVSSAITTKFFLRRCGS